MNLYTFMHCLLVFINPFLCIFLEITLIAWKFNILMYSAYMTLEITLKVSSVFTLITWVLAFDTFMKWFLMYFNTVFRFRLVVTLIKVIFDTFMNWLHFLTWFEITMITKELLNAFMYWLYMYFKMTLLTSFVIALITWVFNSFMNWPNMFFCCSFSDKLFSKELTWKYFVITFCIQRFLCGGHFKMFRYSDSLSRQPGEAIFISKMSGEISNSKSEFHQPSIVKIRREISRGFWLEVIGVKTIVFFGDYLISLSTRKQMISLGQIFTLEIRYICLS